MLQYILQIIAFQLFFLIIYDVFLKRETFFNWNRFYLLGTSILAMILPLIKINAFKEVVPREYIVTLPEVFIGVEPVANTEVILPITSQVESGFSWSFETLFFIGFALALLLFSFKILRIIALVYKNPRRWKGNVLLVRLLQSTAAFSFLHYVFLGEKLHEREQETILKHELVHVSQKHTLDLLFFEVQRIIMWFNPLVYMYQNRVRTLHEYIADAEALKTQNKSDYYQNLLAQVFETQNVSFINAFFKKSLIKKRIIMLSKSKSKQINLIKYVLLIPMVLSMLAYTSSYAQSNLESAKDTQELSDEKLKEKLSKELLEMEDNGASSMEIFKTYKPNLELYIFPRIMYFKHHVYMEYMLSKGEVPVKDLTKELERTYQQYLNYKKTDEAKERWENNIKDGILRLVIDKCGSFTDKEKAEKERKLEMIKNDEYFHSLLIECVNGSVTMTITPDKSEKYKTIPLDEIDVEVPYATIEQPPIFEGCEDLSGDEQKKCTSKKIQKHVVKEFNADLAGDLGLKGRQRINVVFKINKEGEIEGVKVRAPHPELEKEAKRVIESLPKMIPGKQKGETVIVPYSLPIIFQVAEDKNGKDDKKENPQSVNNDEVPYATIEQPPVFEGCEDLSGDEQRKCTSKKIQKHVVKEFNTNLAMNLGLKGRQRINVIFKINKEGNIIGVRSRAPHPRLEEEAIRVIQSLPKMIPGKEKGEAMIVPYSLPIIFQVADSESIKGVELSKDSTVPFAVLDEVPVYPGCEAISNQDELKKCFAEKVSLFVQENFNSKLAKSLSIDGGERTYVVFNISKYGDIINVKCRASNKKLEEESIRVIKLLPKMKPGMYKGETVNVAYSLPIKFE